MNRSFSLASVVFHATFSILLMASTTAGAGGGPSAMRPYTPPYPQPAYRPQPHPTAPASGVSYREAHGYTPARANLGTSAFEPSAGPAVWSGFYAGLHGGYGFGKTTVRDPRVGTVDVNGAFGGAHIGHNWQRGTFVLGLEADVSGDFAKESRRFATGFDLTASRDWTASARTRVGLAIGSMLVFATAGAATAGHTITARNGAAAWRGPETHLGIVYGGGIEWQATRLMTVRGEVLRYDFNDRTMHIGGAQNASKLDDTVVRGGVSFRLN